jgi:MFS family permease
MKEYKKLIFEGNFGFLWISQILSQLTINIINFLILTRLFTVTQSAIATSMLWISYALPAIFLGPIGAASVDMLSKRKMLIYSNLLQSLTVLTYALILRKGLFLPYGFAMIYSLINQFNDPAEASLVPSLVDKKRLHFANGLMFLTSQGALIIGYGIAGLLQTVFGYRNSLILCAGFLLVGALSVNFTPEDKSEDRIPLDIEKTVVKFASRIAEGYKFIKNHKEVLTPFLLLIGLQVTLSIITINVPVIASEIVKINVNAAGVYIVVPVAIGAILGAIYINKFLKKGLRKKQAIEICLIIELIAFLIISLVVGFISINFLRILISTISIIAIGFGFVGLLIPTQTFMQEMTPGGFRGRVFGNFSFIVTIATIFPIIFSGAVTEIFGIKLLMFFIALIIAGVLFMSKKYGQSFLEKEMQNGK